MKTDARLFRLVTVIALFLSIGIYGQSPRHRALLSRDLPSFEARRSAPARVIVNGTRAEIGHPVTESSATDPLCLAVRKATAAGMVVVVSAGNAGKAPDGSTILGGITSPGNSPYAMTAGALNTKTTAARVDDVMATYGSRGPTRFDLAGKPDLVAPGAR